MDTGPRIDSYAWERGREAMLRWGPENGPTVIVASPLFEEANRCRSIMARTMQALAARGIGGALPDLPGTGESLLPTRDARLHDWRAAFAAAAATLPGPMHVLGIRGGALVDGNATVASRWHLSPLGGNALVGELRRAQMLSKDMSFSGNDLADDLIDALQIVEPTTTRPLRVVRLASDPRPADAKLDFDPPWRAAEPGRNDPLASAIANDVLRWIAICAG